MPLTTRVLHADEEYLVVEEAGEPLAPRMQILSRPSNPVFEVDEDSPMVGTDQGPWCLLAQYDQGTLRPTRPQSDDQLNLLREMLKQFLAHRAVQNQKAQDACFYLQVEDRPIYLVHHAQPAGLLIALFRHEEDGRKALQEMGREGRVISTGSLRDFLGLRAEEGFAGALLDDIEPIYWCVDKEEMLQFLKLRPDVSQQELEGHTLNGSGRWDDFDGSRDLEFYDDQDTWDSLMRHFLGPTPYLGYQENPTFFALQREDDWLEILDDEENPMVPLFHERAAAEQFQLELELQKVELVEVKDLPQLLQQVASTQATAQLQPGDHRARSGALWMNGESLVLQTFSGFWNSGDQGASFQLID
jgi:hypothetical protein